MMQHIDAVVPVVEVIDYRIDDIAKYQGLDLIANNIMGGNVTMGPSHKWIAEKTNLNVNGPWPTLQCGNKRAHRVVPRTAMGNQWKALQWITNNLLDQGYTIKKGQFITTGSLGRSSIAEPCDYTADFGQFGSIALKVTP